VSLEEVKEKVLLRLSKRGAAVIGLFLFFFGVLGGLGLSVYWVNKGRGDNVRYEVIVDAGSTGSRVHVYRVDGGDITRIGSKSVTPGLSSFVPAEGDYYDAGVSTGESYLRDLLVNWSRTLICHDHHDASKECNFESPVPTTNKLLDGLQSIIRIRLFATAGMRLLDSETVTAPFYRGVEEGVAGGLVERLDFGCRTLGGDEEGFFGIVAVDHLANGGGARGGGA